MTGAWKTFPANPNPARPTSSMGGYCTSSGEFRTDDSCHGSPARSSYRRTRPSGASASRRPCASKAHPIVELDQQDVGRPVAERGPREIVPEIDAGIVRD